MEIEHMGHWFAVKNRRRKPCQLENVRVTGNSSPLPDVMILGHLIKSAALGPATPYPGVTASFFN